MGEATTQLGWTSEALGHDVQLWRFGTAGKPMLVFPTTSGGCNEVADFGLVEAVRPLIDAGRVRLYTVGCAPAATWMDRTASGAQKSASLATWARFLAEELIPRLTEDVGDPAVRFGAAGINVGAFNAVNVVAKHPDRFDLAIAMSGLFDFDGWMNGHFDSDLYFNQPLRFLPNLEGDDLAAVRAALFVLASGSGRWEDPEQSRRLAHVLRAKAISTSLEIWGPEAAHDWPTWRAMFPLFLERSL